MPALFEIEGHRPIGAGRVSAGRGWWLNISFEGRSCQQDTFQTSWGRCGGGWAPTVLQESYLNSALGFAQSSGPNSQ